MEHVRFDDTSSFNQGAEQEELERTALSFDSLEIMHEKWWFPDKDVLDIDDYLLKNEISSNQDVCTCAHIRCGSDGKATDPFVLKLSNAERQKRYRTRKKLKIADIQNDLNEKSAEYAALVAENIELKENNSALELLSEYALAMLNTITLSSLHRYRQISKLSEASLKFIKDLIGVVIGKLLYSQLTVGEFITVSDSLRDTGHRNYFFSSWLVYHANLLTEVRRKLKGCWACWDWILNTTAERALAHVWIFTYYLTTTCSG